MKPPSHPKNRRRVKENDGRHIATVMSNALCVKHQAGRDEPCYWITNNVIGVCGDRVKKAGFNPSPETLKATK